jgi:hypothetical protein
MLHAMPAAAASQEDIGGSLHIQDARDLLAAGAELPGEAGVHHQRHHTTVRVIRHKLINHSDESWDNRDLYFFRIT